MSLRDRLDLRELGVLTETEPNVRDLLNFLESQARLTYCLFLPLTANAELTVQSKIRERAGYGVYLQQLANLRGQVSGPLADLYDDLASKQLEASTTLLGGRSIMDWRNYLSHGGIAPSADGFDINILVRHVENINELISAVGDNVELRPPQAGGFVELDCQGSVVLNPLLWATDHSMGFFQEILTDGEEVTAVYVMLDRKTPEIEQQLTPSMEEAVKRFVSSGQSAEAGEIRRFKKAIIEDAGAFSDGKWPVQFDVDSTRSPFVARWRRRTSEGIEERADLFSINAGDNSRKWRRSGEDGPWFSYKAFVKDIANWNTLIPRLEESLDEKIREHEEWDRQNFGEFSVLSNLTLPERTVREVEVIGRSFSALSSRGSTGITHRLDESAQQYTGVPQVYFLSGEAGVGKTYTLLTIASQRYSLLRKGAEDVPAFLYMDCSGLRLSSLHAAINSAVASTLILTADRVMTLCRTGLMVVIVDGFDELLGGAGYGNALQVLRPTLRKLEGSGTLLISARSAYLANQYRDSLNELQSVEDVAEHLILQMERWSVPQIGSFFEANSHWAMYRGRLSNEDLQLLGLPFFARVFDRFVNDNSGRDPHRSTDLVGLLLNAYLDRELRKLQQANLPEVEFDDLHSLLVECAGMMLESGSRELQREDFNMCAMVAFNRESFAGRLQALQARLSVLCGISSRQGEDELLFSFDHEIYFDSLIIDFLISNVLLPWASAASVRAAFDREVFAETVMRGLVSREPERCYDVIRELGGLGARLGGNLSSNIGALLCEYIGHGRPLGLSSLVNLSMVTLDLSHLSFGTIEFVGCEINCLRLNASFGSLVLRDTRINAIQVVRGASSRGLENVNFSFSGALELGELTVLSEDGSRVSEIFDQELQVLESLHAMGVQGVLPYIEEWRRSSPGPLEAFSINVLNKFIGRRTMVFIVEEKSLLPGRGAPKWLSSPDDERWARFVAALEGSGAGQRKRINASGVAKSQVSFLVRPAELAKREDQTDPRVREFWRIVSA
ncbi:hypothetical protein GCM10012320_35170 [Sinomonas cellulolyticus]|uniref:NACHT domain-containing protein n=1 Tax=Sinomonas cellulolyticus TaxID=2801916 RepID=A0ABS1K0A4_9MICC|nr:MULTISPECIES: hypothetical protein [Sinomonas]MBL0705081.1 hypothetical protein [Sinomonas cellulolyticus]GHG60564.1 hypothetical protein GCM10012320_35170 [Sinomonas sp. KCTC 49339]